MKRYWYKTYVQDILSKERMQMPDWLFRRLIEFEALAADYGADGLLPPVKDMAWTLRPVEETKLSEALQSLAEVGEAEETPEGWRLTHFEGRQQSDSYDRVRKFREKKRNEVKHGVTPVTDEADDALLSSSSSESDSGSESSLEGEGVGGETIPTPETPAEAKKHPDIQAYQAICGRIPGVRDYEHVISTIQLLRARWGAGLVEKAKVYWLAWSAGRNKQTGQPYDPGSLVWLDEWAVNEQIPRAKGREPKSESREKYVGGNYADFVEH